MSQCVFCSETLPVVQAPGERPEVAACTTCLNPNLVEDTGSGPTSRAVPGTPDMRSTAPAESIGGDALRVLCRTIDDIPPLPEISLRVMEMMNDDDAGINDLASAIKDDAVIAGNVLKMANSAMYGGLSEVTDVVGACSRLGMRTVANVVQTVSARKLFDVGDDSMRDLISVIGSHAIAVAYCAHDIAVHTAQPNPEACFVGGLLHDVGKIGLISAVSQAKDGPAANLANQPELLAEVLEGYHGLAGLLVAQSWNLPAKFGTAIYFHHSPEAAPSDQSQHLAHIIALSNLVAHATGFPSNVEREETPLGSLSCEYVGLSDIQLATLRVDLEDRLQPFFDALA